MATILTFQDVWIPPPPPVPPSPLEPSAVQRVGSTSTPVDSTSTEEPLFCKPAFEVRPLKSVGAKVKLNEIEYQEIMNLLKSCNAEINVSIKSNANFRWRQSEWRRNSPTRNQKI